MSETVSRELDIQKIREQFPILHQQVNGQPLVYFDNAATTQKPQVVLDTIAQYYQEINSNVHRGVHHLSQLATDAFEQSREKVRTFINAAHTHEVIFTGGTTDSINLLTTVMGKGYITEGDEVIISGMEHHSNIVPWQMLCEQTGAKLKVIPVNDKGELQMEGFRKLLGDRTRIVAVNHISNTLGTINPVKEIIDLAHESGAKVFIDGAQAAPHLKIDVQVLDVDFYAFSAHKMYGPTGAGVLYGKEDLLNQLPPYKGGGEMIKTVTLEKSTYADLPHKFEAGTPHIEGVIAMGAAIDFLNAVGLENIAQREGELLIYAKDKLSSLRNIRYIGEAEQKTSVISFLLGDIHPYDAGVILDKMGIAVRTGHHCTQPLMDRFKIPGTIRASLCFYNTEEEIDRMVDALHRVEKMFS